MTTFKCIAQVRFDNSLEKVFDDGKPGIEGKLESADDREGNAAPKKLPNKMVPYERPNWKKKLFRDVRKIISDDWMFLTLLGISVALLSFCMDYCIERILKMRVWIYEEAALINDFLAYLAWTMLCLLLVVGSAFFSHIVAAQAIGSGIPELKTILRGVLLKEYLTFKTLVSKVVGLTMSLGSGLPIGKEGPFVHISSIIATLLNKGLGSLRSINENENREAEMLAAACAVGVACTFGAPVGGKQIFFFVLRKVSLMSITGRVFYLVAFI
ncbi:unnamed protein product [Soboliphyme baturini]|uniref:Chloride channel protein n=1 Tax=Soboliphyme baturini TaxID=241478 RepID=A0A183IQX9_9BILA|nr:unnamed protein product [Soboliphyme baturini]